MAAGLCNPALNLKKWGAWRPAKAQPEPIAARFPALANARALSQPQAGGLQGEEQALRTWGYLSTGMHRRVPVSLVSGTAQPPNNSLKPTPSSVPLSAVATQAILHSTGRGRRGLTQALDRQTK